MPPSLTDTPAGAVRAAVERLIAAGLDRQAAIVDAGVLARWVLGWDAGTWITRARDPAPIAFAAPFAAAIDRRVRREPVSQITGEREFYGRAFHVTRDVLTPRPETEHVVAEALASLAARPVASDEDDAPAIVDVGTGSGCLAVTLALAAPATRIIATDVSPAALDIARGNAARHGVTDRITFLAADLFPAGLTGATLVISNPPYVAERDRATLDPEVARFEPGAALFAGDDGLDVIRRLVPAAADVLRPGGRLVMEIGQGQADAVRRLVVAAGLTWRGVTSDLQGIPRVVVAARPA